MDGEKEQVTSASESVKISLDSAETHYNAGYSDGYRAAVSDISTRLAFFVVIGVAWIVALRKLL